MNNSLKKKSISGIIWNLTERLGNQFIRFFIGIVLAQVLLPEDYGVVGLTTVIIVVAQIFIDGGFMMVLIQRKDNTDLEYSTVFWIKMLLSFISYFVIFFSADFISDFYQIPSFSNVLKVTSLVLIISALSSVHKVKLTNELNFKIQAQLILLSTIIGGVFGVFFAYSNYGVWSLVYQTLIINALQTIFFLMYCRWIPLFRFSYEFTKSISKLGFNYLFSNILLILYNNLYVVIIGKIFSPAVLGNYTRALQFEQLPENTTNSIIVKVLFPILTKNKDNLQQLKVNTLQIISWLSFIVTPIMVMLMIFSKQIISLLLTDAWLSSSDFLIIVSFSGLFIPINNSILNIFNVLGKPIITVWVYFFKIIFSLIAIFSLWKLGPLYVVSVMIIENVLVFFILSYFTNDLIGLKFIEIIKSMFSAFAINTIIAILVLLISQISIIGSLSSLLYIIVISFIYAILLILLNLLTNSLQGQELKKQLNKYFK
jgi:O-antigen/teichoic acid export membrane protein